MVSDRLITINQFCKKHNFKIRNIIEFMLEMDFISDNNLPYFINKKYRQRNKKRFISNVNFVHITEEYIFIDYKKFYDVANNNSLFSDIVINTTRHQSVDEIEDYSSKKRILKDTINKKVLFIDFEFVNNQYYEAAYQMQIGEKIVDSGYFFEKEVLDTGHLLLDNKFIRLKKIHKKLLKISGEINKMSDYQIIYRRHINMILLDRLNEADFIVAHNKNSEIAILEKNGIKIADEKWICTSNLNTKLFGLEKSETLYDLSQKLSININNTFLHYAKEDVETISKVFYNLIKLF